MDEEIDLGDLLGLFSAFTRPPKPLARAEVKGLIVSTVHTVDMGWETALLDAEQTIPVQRYPSMFEAKDGHNKWCEKAKTIRTVEKLGYGSLVAAETVQLKRRVQKKCSTNSRKASSQRSPRTSVKPAQKI